MGSPGAHFVSEKESMKWLKKKYLCGKTRCKHNSLSKVDLVDPVLSVERLI